MDKVIIIYDNNIYQIEKEPFGTDENTYKRGWFIIRNIKDNNYEETVNKSIIYLNESKNNMKYP